MAARRHASSGADGMTGIVAFRYLDMPAVRAAEKRFGKRGYAALYVYDEIHFGCAAFIETRAWFRKKRGFYGSLEAALQDYRDIDAGNLMRRRGDRHAPAQAGNLIDDDAVLW